MSSPAFETRANQRLPSHGGRVYSKSRKTKTTRRKTGSNLLLIKFN